jgi:multicomponent Na+:H+ antiporter subunit C
MEEIVPKFNYIVVVILMMTGLWSMLAQSNLIKKCIGMAIFQTGIILFFISIGAKNNASIPIVAKEPLGQAHAPEGSQPIAKPELAAAKSKAYPDPPDINKLTNPLTQILMLTAIVVGVATLGVGLALAQKVYQQHKSFDEDEILENQTK